MKFRLRSDKMNNDHMRLNTELYEKLYYFICIVTSCSFMQSALRTAKGRTGFSFSTGRILTAGISRSRDHALNENYKNTFRVEDGVMKVRYDEYDKFNDEYGHIFYKEPFSHYKLRIEYRFVGEQVPGGPAWAFRNSGVMLHSQSAASMLLDQDFPVSIEAQFLGGDGISERTTRNVCTPGTHIVMNGAADNTAL
ncbi:MAG: DUF1080 domain-containing protein [Marinilabiliales bacterium]|nr:DUF1080 domain-containing protein [Marinilabiliales bacterium]